MAILCFATELFRHVLEIFKLAIVYASLDFLDLDDLASVSREWLS